MHHLSSLQDHGKFRQDNAMACGTTRFTRQAAGKAPARNASGTPGSSHGH